MPRAEVGTQKWLANKMKAKGLQKLRWYCQMCEKQCRDENGFKCHRMSESHQRQMQVFCQNPDRFMDDFSRQFESSFMKLMKTRYCRTRILANTVYTEMISHKEHIHMNSTIWVTLSEFVQYLGQAGKCKIDLTPKGWFLEYIDREKIEREREAMRKRRQELTLEEMNTKRIESLISEAKIKGSYQEPEFTELKRNGSEKIILSNIGTSNSTKGPSKVGINIFLQHDHVIQKSQDSSLNNTNLKTENKHKLSNLDKLMFQNEVKKIKKEDNLENSSSKKQTTPFLPSDYELTCSIQSDKMKNSCWLFPGLIVKIIDPELSDEQYYRNKATVLEVYNKSLKAKLQILRSDTIITLSQHSLETVIPNLSGQVKILKGNYKGYIGKLLEVDTDKLLITIELCENDPKDNGPIKISSLQLDEVCKYSPL